MTDQPVALCATTEMLLPGDFARRVLSEVRFQRRRRRKRNRMATAVASCALLLGLTFALGHGSRGPVGVASNTVDSYVLQTQWDSSLDQLAQATAPDQPGDYLTPAAAWTASDESNLSAYAAGDLDWQS